MSQLFTDLSAEQQEIVAGGQGLDALTKDLSQFNALAAIRQVGTAAGPGGAATASQTAFQQLASLGISELKVTI
ncbi:CTB family bacteriocin [Brasilonema octagenarum]|uniref:Bacteriocin n=1 Tax=Brasilonema octagenarum UFV-OR1 TaxID=417115 RepID=A0ABX1M642_9CYAN|nr:CTB family bacteriocin [Brasilonema octagenarum]NMF62893.1 hypothetical protein [Brasilonema octagenarum UFV-OR1]